ncbi:TPA: hypothetical protein DIS56_00200 [Candidatus Saccharibacteria bacterium]|nr:hypothetical protein [Candidatus Saccharibacteria bacterium]
MVLFLKNQGVEPPSEPVKRGRGRPRKYQVDAIRDAIGPGPIASNTTGSNHSARAKNFVKANRTILFIGLIVILATVPAIYFYSQNNNANKKLNDLQKNSQSADTAQQTIEVVGKLVLLPEGEQPTIATVTDPTKLKGQAFFASAQTGDKVLVYNKAGRAILYRPSLNKIIEMAPLNTDTTAQ